MVPRTLLELRGEDLLRIPIFCQLSIRRGLDDRLFIPMKRMIEDCGYQPNRNEGRINDRVERILKLFEKNGYISILNRLDLRLGDTVEISVTQDFFDLPTSFCIITLEEFYKIITYRSDLAFSSSKIMPEYLLCILSHIRINKSRRSVHQQKTPESKPEIFFQQQKNIAKSLDISAKTLQRGIDILEKLDIIVSRPMPRYKDSNDNWHTDVTIFVDKYEGWEQELRWGIDFLKTGKKLKYVQGSGTKGGGDMD